MNVRLIECTKCGRRFYYTSGIGKKPHCDLCKEKKK